MRVFGQEKHLAGRIVLRGRVVLTAPRNGESGWPVAEFSAHLKPFHGRIHAPVYVGVLVATLPMDRSRRVDLLHLRYRMAEAIAMSRLVACGPYQHGRMVAVEKHVPCIPLDYRVVELREASQRLLAPAWLMPLDIGLRHDIESVPVAEVVPPVVVWIMRGADGIDIIALHETDVREHVFNGDSAPVLRIRLVSVDALEFDWLPVYQQSMPRYHDILETDLARTYIGALLYNERV